MKAQAPTQPTYQPMRRRNEKAEKNEKHEKRGEASYRIWLLAGVIVIIVGLLSYLQAAGLLNSQYMSAFLFLVVGAALVLFALYAYTTRQKRFPSPSG